MKQFIVKVLGVTFILALVGWIVFSLFIPEYYIKVLPFTLLFFLIVTISVHAWQLKMAKKNAANFTRSSMLLTFIKLIIYSVFAITYIAYDKDNSMIFVVCLMIIYFVYTFLEVFELSRFSRKQ